MNVVCADCRLQYDDTYRLTYCPHPSFDMHTLTAVNGVEYCCHNVSELDVLTRADMTMWATRKGGMAFETCPVYPARRRP